MDATDFDINSETTAVMQQPPPPPYSLTENTPKMSIDAAAAAVVARVPYSRASLPSTPVTPSERAAARVDLSVRRSKALSRAGLDDPVFFKMSQLERLVNSLQSALNNQSMAIHDVHGQLSEINDVLHTMQTKSDPDATCLTEAMNEPVEPERLVEDLRAAAAKFSDARKVSASPSTTVTPIAESASPEPNVQITENILPKARDQNADDVRDDDEAENDTFEDAEDDGDYLRLCSMLEQLITEANIAVETPVTPTPTVLVNVDIASEGADKSEDSASEPVSPSESACTNTSLSQTDLKRRRQRCSGRRKSGARVRPVDLLASLENNACATDFETDVEHETCTDASDTTGTIYNRLTSEPATLPEDEVGLVDPTAADAPDAIEVRFYCQVTRTGGEPQQHEIRRRLVLPLVTGANMTPTNLRRIMTGAVGTSTEDKLQANGFGQEDVDVESAGTLAVMGSRRNVIRRALGTVQLMYWLLLFTLGVLLLDAYLCELAGTQAVQVVDGIRPDERRRRPRGLLTGADNTSSDVDHNTDEGRLVEYTGMKPVTMDGATASISGPAAVKRNRARRNSF